MEKKQEMYTEVWLGYAYLVLGMIPFGRPKKWKKWKYNMKIVRSKNR
jgi:uncharacterized protein YjeT (DUF2065 family)